MSVYGNIDPIREPIPADRQGAKRHYGVHPYFTRRPFNVVRDYIQHYSREGDVVVDPFGGSGVTAIEAFLHNRAGIHNDVNPFANFIANGIADLHRGNLADYQEALEEIQARGAATLNQIPGMTDAQLCALRSEVRLPENLPLPRTSDVAFYHDLFSPTQLIALAFLKTTIDQLPSSVAKSALMLAWSATLTKVNKTFLSATGRAASRGGSSIFSIYRYKVAKNPVELPVWEVFKERASNVLSAKAEIDRVIEYNRASREGWIGTFNSCSLDVVDLAALFENSVDYIFTDPPYGGHISYLDLSTLWNVWLEQLPSEQARQSELIVGGALDHKEQLYINRLGQSIKACLRMLKKDRWLSIVFQHWNVAYFEAILSSAAESGGELRAAVSQVGDPIWSMHKKKGSDSVLAGELILTFFKSGSQRITQTKPEKFDIAAEIGDILASSAMPMYGEHIFNRLVVNAWHRSAIRHLNISKEEFTHIIQSYGWQYDSTKHYWVKEKEIGSATSLFGN